MRMTRILVFVFALFFLFGVTVFIPQGFVTKWGVEPVYAGQPIGKPEGPPPEKPVGPPVTPRNTPVSVPEPTTLILLGVGLAAVGGYTALRFKKNKNEK